jgi:hypothetical protein
VRKPVPTRVMREHPDLDQLKRQAKELLEAFRDGDTVASAEVGSHFEGADRFTLAETGRLWKSLASPPAPAIRTQLRRSIL